MKEFTISHPQDNPIDDGRTEVVGSTSLKDVLLEHGTIRGTWYLNRHEFRNFEATNPAHVVHFINEATPKTGVVASVDDGFHLVLVNASGPIAISSGAAIDRSYSGIPADAPDKPKDVLELLGLEATDDESVAEARGIGWVPGLSAEERRRQEDERRIAAGEEPLDASAKAPPAPAVTQHDHAGQP